MTPRSAAAPHFGTDFVVPVQHMLGVAVESVGGDVPGAEELQHLGQRNRRSADVDHHAAAGAVRRIPGALHRGAGVPVGYGVDMHPDLNAVEKAGVALDGAGGLVYVNDPHIVEPAAEDPVGRQTDGPDVQKGQQPGAVGPEIRSPAWPRS